MKCQYVKKKQQNKQKTTKQTSLNLLVLLVCILTDREQGLTEATLSSLNFSGRWEGEVTKGLAE